MPDKPRLYSLRKGAEPASNDAVLVDRSTPWGNPFLMYGTSDRERNRVCDAFEEWAEAKDAQDPEWLRPLRGKSLICWCHPKRCHASTLLRLAQKGTL